jgi:hypothetical protein
MRFICWVALLSFSIAASSTLKESLIVACPCLNGGECRLSSAGVGYCTCPSAFIGSTCDKEAMDLSTLSEPVNITESDSYFYLAFNSSTLYYVEIFFCPLEYDPAIVYYVQIEFEDENGSLSALSAAQPHSLVPR